MTKDDSFLEYYSNKIIKDLKYVIVSTFSSICFHFYVKIFKKYYTHRKCTLSSV